MDENLSLYRYMKPAPGGDIKLPTRNLTIQWCISSEALNAGNQAYGGTWGGQDSTFHRNLFACNTARNLSIRMSGEFDCRNNVMTPNGIVSNPKEAGGYPEYNFSPAAVPPDIDGDGMPDDWEKAHGLNQNDTSDGPTDEDKNGYTNVEEFLNGTDPGKFIEDGSETNAAGSPSASDAKAAAAGEAGGFMVSGDKDAIQAKIRSVEAKLLSAP